MDALYLIELFCHIDDFWKNFKPKWEQHQVINRSRKHWWSTRDPALSSSEIMTICVYFHLSKYRTFKDYYLYEIKGRCLKYFPKAVSYHRFVKLMKKVIFPLFTMQKSFEGKESGIAFIDSTILSVCHIARASSHKVFKKQASKGKTTTGWFFGLKLHLVINEQGEILSWMITPGNTSDIKPVENLTAKLKGKLIGDKGYISKKLLDKLRARGLHLITKIRSNMKNKLMEMWDKMLLKKRGVIESVINRLKFGCHIQHHRHRCPINFFINLVAGLTAYSMCHKKPSLV